MTYQPTLSRTTRIWLSRLNPILAARILSVIPLLLIPPLVGLLLIFHLYRQDGMSARARQSLTISTTLALANLALSALIIDAVARRAFAVFSTGLRWIIDDIAPRAIDPLQLLI